MSGVVAWDGSSGKSRGAEGGWKEYGGCGGGGVSEGLEGVIAGWVTGASVCGLRNKEVFMRLGMTHLYWFTHQSGINLWMP